MTTMKTSSCLLHLPFHNAAIALSWCQGDCHHSLFHPHTSLPYAPLLGRAGRNDDNNDDPRGDDNVDDVRPRPPNTQQPAIVGGGGGGGNKDNKEEEYDGSWRMMGEAALAPEKRRAGGPVPSSILPTGFFSGGMPKFLRLSKD